MAHEPVELYRLMKNDVKETSVLLYRAFSADPLARAVVPDEPTHDLSIWHRAPGFRGGILRALRAGYVRLRRHISPEVGRLLLSAVEGLDEHHEDVNMWIEKGYRVTSKPSTFGACISMRNTTSES